MNKILLLIGIFILTMLFSIISLIIIDSITNPSGKIKNEDAIWFLAFFLSIGVICLVGGFIL